MGRKKKNHSRRPSASNLSAADETASQPTAVTVSSNHKWIYRLTAAILLPLLALAGTELTLRVAGYGYSTGFFKRASINGHEWFVENDQFGLRFFPPGLARIPSPVLMSAKKAPGTIRVFIFGESAALGDPRPNYGAGRYLEALLRARFPQENFEVVNTAVTAINSHAILPIARECAGQQGDVWIVYMGNNEMVGPFGAATVFGLRAPPLRLVRWQLLLQRTRLGQLLSAWGRKLRPASTNPSRWHGMEMFLNSQIPPNDARKEVVYRNFRRNLEDLLRAGLDSGAKIVLSTVAVNLEDCPPFATWPGTNLPASDRAALENLSKKANDDREQGDLADAAREYEQTVKILPQSADLQYLLGDCLLRLTNTAAARQHFQLAVDNDSLPFRADSHIDATLKAAANEFSNDHLVLCDATKALVASGIPGRESFFEHVHLNFTGNYLLARAWAEKIQHLLAGRLGPAASEDWLPQKECERRLGLTDWNRSSVLEEMLRRMQEPPFRDQLENSRRLAALSNELDECRARIAATPAAEAARVYESALATAPSDFRLHENFAEFLEANHDRRATVERQKVRDLIPQVYFSHYRLGLDLEEDGRLEEAVAALRQAERLSPAQSEIRLQLGMVYARQREWGAALDELEQALQLEPQDPRPYLYAGEVLWKLNRPSESISRLQQALRLRPDYWEAHYRLGDELAQEQEVSAAADEFEQVVRLNPNYVKARLNLGVALYKLGHASAAREQFDAVLRLDPQNREALEFRTHVSKDSRP